ncbi:uncharacterized protein LOC125033417 [Penaeus chinensis]|uniref:uncharacterized protein LOC125033417 n=1 Tax=Penaeus chinensis TaxID=139456 RepID=UPI001FB5C600|nr:uncharacterized protein LOC125033417 [Penaeus chinensis]
MLPLKSVIAVLAFVTVATAAKLETLDNASLRAIDSEEVAPGYQANQVPVQSDWQEEEEDDDLYDYDYEDYPDNGNSEEYSTPPDGDSNADEYEDYGEEEFDEQEQDESEGGVLNRQKRKLIYGGGAYGRRGGSRGGSPYGRRRSNQNYHGPDYGPGGGGSSGGYHGRRSSPVAAPPSRPTTVATVAKPTAAPKKKSASNVQPTYKSKTGRRETKKKLSKELKTGIAKYAIQNGNGRAAEHYRDIIGRKLSEKTIEKFVKRHQKKLKKNQKGDQ